MTWTTLVLGLVQTDLYCMGLWRDLARETFFDLSKVYSMCWYIKTEGKDVVYDREMSILLELLISLKQMFYACIV